MQKYIPTYTDISEWNLQEHLNTGGSRSKKIAINPKTDEEYFFKGSKITKDGGIRYPMEFWSEIVSSKIGKYLGFPVLDYNIAYRADHHKQKVGCISKSMVVYSENRLTEGKEYLTGYDSNYNPEKDKKEYTFQFISKSLKYFELQKYIPKIIEIIVFDAIISNSDRHQENWGILHNFKDTYVEIDKVIEDMSSNSFKKFILKSLKFILQSKNDEEFSKSVLKNKFLKRIFLHFESEIVLHNFAPIYDSGCCLGREIDDSEIAEYLSNNDKLFSYINKGVAEIHWEGKSKKQTHFDLIELLKKEFSEDVKNCIERTLNKYNKSDIEEIITNIDRNLPEAMESYKLPDIRKKLMIKIITLRLEKLKEIK
ncbi:MAG: hypothetical protein IPO21_14820 [Bacteroidales bacterium]|nr:hypothetical protein [Bacteroidales bacterium]